MRIEKTKRKVFTWLLIFTMVFSLIPVEIFQPVYATGNGEKPSTLANENEFIPQPIELPWLRTETSKVYGNPDGTYTAEVLLDPIHYYEDNEWKEIDNTLTPTDEGTAFVNKSNQFKVKFNKNPKLKEKMDLFTYSIGKHEVTFSLNESNESKKPKKHHDAKEKQAKKKENMLEYEDLYEGVTFEYVVDGSKVKENIILDSYRGKNSFEFIIQSNGLRAEKKEDGSIDFFDEKTNEFVFFIQRPYMYDSNTTDNIEGIVSFDVTQDIVPIEDGYLLTITADEEFLTDPARVYPVVIDPWIDVFQAQDTFIAQGKPTVNYSAAHFLSIGNNTADHGNTRTLLRWTSLPDLGKVNAHITGASIGINQYASNSNETIQLHRVTSDYQTNTVTWNTQPQFQSAATAIRTNAANGYNYLTVTNLVRDWYSGASSNFGVLLRYTNENAGFKHFRSTEWNNPNGTLAGKPKLVISFRPNELLGVQSYWNYTPDLFQGEGSAVVNVLNGNMIYSIPLLNLPGKTSAFNLGLTYNSRSTYDSFYGYGWTFSAQRELIVNRDSDVVEYISEDGSRLHFSKTQDDTNETYTPLEGVYLQLEKDGTGYKLTQPNQTVLYFDDKGRNTRIEDENGNQILYEFSGSTSRVTKISERYKNEGAGRDLHLNYDAENRLSTVTDFRGTEHRLTYERVDEKNRLKTIEYASNRPERKVITFTYNALHWLTNIIDANGNIGTVEYDANNRVTKLIDPRGANMFAELRYPTLFETVFMDARGNQTYYRHTNHLNQATANVIEITENYQGTSPATSLYEWKRNTLEKVTEPNKENGTPTGAEHTATYDENSNQLTSDSPNNTGVEKNTYDGSSNLIEEKHKNGSYIQNKYDAESNLIFRKNEVQLTDYFRYDKYGN